MVACADTPLLRGATLAALVQEHHATEAAATVLTARVANPTGYGRIIRDESGTSWPSSRRPTPPRRSGPWSEINSGVYAFEGAPAR